MAADPRPKTATAASARPNRLSGSDALLRAVVDAALDGIVVIDRNGLILSIDKGPPKSSVTPLRSSPATTSRC